MEAIIDSDDWAEALRHAHPDKDHAKPSDKDHQTERGDSHEHGGEHEYTLTPLRMMIQKMPGELVLASDS